MFESRDFFLPKEILPPKKRARSQLSSSTSALPQVFEIGENYHGASDTAYARHEEQIKTILNHLDELPLERIKHIEDKREQIRHDDEIVLARVRTSTLKILIEDIQTSSMNSRTTREDHQTTRLDLYHLQLLLESNHWKVNQSPRNLMS
ncbi:hypothetical protein Tco_0055282 [Tanacetum coccineum]